ncbi:MAG: hypothetical protein C6I00_04975 [Nitratiruptor sp.]|nr:hypothetical protein [Nitratiruptor sp.]
MKTSTSKRIFHPPLQPSFPHHPHPLQRQEQGHEVHQEAQETRSREERPSPPPLSSQLHPRPPKGDLPSHHSQEEPDSSVHKEPLDGRSERLHTGSEGKEFQELMEQPKRFFRFQLAHTRIGVGMVGGELQLHFTSSRQLLLDGIEPFVEGVMEEYGFERYEVKIQDQKERRLVRSRGGRSGSIPQGTIDVKA